MNKQAVVGTARIVGFSTAVALAVAAFIEMLTRLDAQELSILGMIMTGMIFVYLIRMIYVNECDRLAVEERAEKLEQELKARYPG